MEVGLVSLNLGTTFVTLAVILTELWFFEVSERRLRNNSKMIEIHLSLGSSQHWHNDRRIKPVFNRMLEGLLCVDRYDAWKPNRI